MLLDDVPHTLLDILGSSSPQEKAPSSAARVKAVRDAEDYVRANEGDPVRVHDLATACGVTTRTLEFAFKDHYGMSPKAYLKSVQLARVRRGLRKADPATAKVSDIANEWGFWHMGQFAADYRNQFGELPSATLKRL
jgi:AraC family ethanolamine operon transcriptional activator